MKTGDKSKILSVRITEDLDEYLDKIAAATGNKRSECVRKLLISARTENKVKLESRESFLQKKKIIYEINQIGKNINQIAHNTNTGIYTEYEKSKLFALMQNLKELLDEKL